MKFKERFSEKSLKFLAILWHIFVLVVCGVLLLNPLAGIIEPVPDLIPGIGNLDEIVELLIMYWTWPKLTTAIEEFKKPSKVESDKQLDDVQYIDVKAEVVNSDSDATEVKQDNDDNDHARDAQTEPS